MAPLQSGNAAFLGSRLSMSANERKHDIFFSAAHRRGFFLCKEERENAAKKKENRNEKETPRNSSSVRVECRPRAIELALDQNKQSVGG